MTPRLRYALWRATPGAYFGLGLAALAAVLVPLIDAGQPTWPMWSLFGVCLAIVGGFTLVEYLRHGLRYDDGPLTVTVHPGCVPSPGPAEWREVSMEWWRVRWQDWALRHDYSRADLLEGGEVRIVPKAPHTGWYRDSDGGEDWKAEAWLNGKEAPEGEDASRIPDADPDRAGIHSHGQHIPSARLIRLHDKKALEMGRSSTPWHELDLLACEVAAVRDGPLEREGAMDSIEQEKINWMESEGIR